MQKCCNTISTLPDASIEKLAHWDETHPFDWMICSCQLDKSSRCWGHIILTLPRASAPTQTHSRCMKPPSMQPLNSLECRGVKGRGGQPSSLSYNLAFMLDSLFRKLDHCFGIWLAESSCQQLSPQTYSILPYSEQDTLHQRVNRLSSG